MSIYVSSNRLASRLFNAFSVLPSFNVKTARSWRGIVSFTHLAREGRLTVTIGRRELLAIERELAAGRRSCRS